MEPITITAKQQKEMDIYFAERRALSSTLEIAMCFHTNQSRELARRNFDWWEDIIAVYKLDETKIHEYLKGTIREKETK